MFVISKGKLFSEALILASTNPQYDKRLFLKIPVQYIKIASSGHLKRPTDEILVFEAAPASRQPIIVTCERQQQVIRSPQKMLVFHTFVGSWVISVSRTLGK